MEISFDNLREKEVVNIYDGKKLGHVIDIIFERQSGKVTGVVVPGIKKFMKKSEDIFVPIENLKKIGEDVLLIRLAPQEELQTARTKADQEQLKTYMQFKRTVKKETGYE